MYVKPEIFVKYVSTTPKVGNSPSKVTFEGDVCVHETKLYNHAVSAYTYTQRRCPVRNCEDR